MLEYLYIFMMLAFTAIVIISDDSLNNRKAMARNNHR